jgi:hypothetical protein
MTTKRFDCLDMKRRGAEQVRQRLAGMTLQQEIEYWRQGSEQFRLDQERLHEQAKPAPASHPSRKGRRREM